MGLGRVVSFQVRLRGYFCVQNIQEFIRWDTKHFGQLADMAKAWLCVTTLPSLDSLERNANLLGQFALRPESAPT